MSPFNPLKYLSHPPPATPAAFLGRACEASLVVLLSRSPTSQETQAAGPNGNNPMWQQDFNPQAQTLPDGQSPSDSWSTGSAQGPPVPTNFNVEDWYVFFPTLCFVVLLALHFRQHLLTTDPFTLLHAPIFTCPISRIARSTHRTICTRY